MAEEKGFARKIVMDATQTAMKIFRHDNPLPADLNDAYFDRQLKFVNAYIFAHVSEEIRLAAI